jgi:hypothetical protein
VRRTLIIAALVLAGLGALAIRVVVEGRSALADGDGSLARGKPADAIRSFEASARWYLPLAPHVGDAYARLRELMASEDPAVAIAAARALRSAARATRTLWTPHADDLAAADERIAHLSARDPQAAPSGNTTKEREAWHLGRLSRDSRPSTGAAAVAALGILLWIAGFVALFRSQARRPALIAGATIVVGLVCWAAGLYNA